MDLVACRLKSAYSSSSSLNDSLLVEIFARLPSKSAFRLKLVCKHWSSLISSHYFITFFNHRRHHQSLPPISNSDSDSFLFQFDSNSSSSSFLVRSRSGSGSVPEFCGHEGLDLSFLPHPQSRIRVKASCADLILCSFNKSRTTTYFYVCNLRTRQWLALPPAHNFEELAIGFLCVPSPCSFCSGSRSCGRVDNSRYKFMVARLHQLIFDLPPFLGRVPTLFSEFKVDIFSSEEGEWRTDVVSSLRAIPFRPNNTRPAHLVAHRGMLHWLTSGVILVFDPYNDPKIFCRVIDMPVELRHRHHSHSHRLCRHHYHSFGVYQDNLRAVYSGIVGDRCYTIWELEDYKMGKWSLVHKVYRSGMQYIHPDGNVVYNVKESIWLCNMLNGVAGDHHYELIHSGAGLYVWETVHQIAAPDQWWPTPVPPMNL